MEAKHFKILNFLDQQGKPVKVNDFPNEITSDFNIGLQRGSFLFEIQIELKNKDWVDHDSYADANYWISPHGQQALKNEIQRLQQVEVSKVANQTIYHIQQAGAVGTNATAYDNTFNQCNNFLPENIDFNLLASELSALRQALLKKAKSPEDFAVIGEVSKAEIAIKHTDHNKIAASLLAAGKWALNTATEIGTNVVAEIIKKSMLEK